MRYARLGCLLIWILSLLLPTAAGALTEVSGHITTDTTWDLAGSPYVVTADVIVRHSAADGSVATLTIAPGVMVAFEPDTRLVVGRVYGSHFRGALYAVGTEAQPILFTSNAATPAPGDWEAIRFIDPTDDAATRLAHCVVEYGGQTYDTTIDCDNASPTITDCTIRHSSGYGINCDTSAFPVVTGTTFTDNADAPIGITPAGVANLADNSGDGNGRNGIVVREGHVTADATWVRQDLPYLVTGDVTVRHPEKSGPTATLTLEAGTILRFAPSTGLFMGYLFGSRYHGALVAVGTASEPILFSSASATPAPGDWKGIRFADPTDDVLTRLAHCVVEYGGQTYNANIDCDNASPTITDCTIRHSSGYGINCDTSAFPVVTGTTFADNADAPIGITPAGVANLADNSGDGNGRNGIVVREGHVTADATWVRQDLPYLVTGDVTVRHPTKSGPTTTLTLEPGTILRFAPSTGLFMGYLFGSRYHGALVAVGTASEPILFSSASATPAPGDWKGIRFADPTDDVLTRLAHCVVEYGGQTYNANIDCDRASPTITDCTIRHSSGYGIACDSDAFPALTGNTLSHNGLSAIAVSPAAVANLAGNTGEGNGRNVIRIRGGRVQADATWACQDLPYLRSPGRRRGDPDLVRRGPQPGRQPDLHRPLGHDRR